MAATYTPTHLPSRSRRLTVSCPKSKRGLKRNPIERRTGHRATVMATTPIVVPRPRSVCWPSVRRVSPPPLEERMNATMVAITARLFRIGANICAAYRLLDVRIPPATAPTP